MNRSHRALVALFLALVLPACEPDETGNAVSVSLDRSSIMPGGMVSYAVVNRSFKTISIPNCCFRPVVYVQRRNGTAWTESFAIGDPCLLKCATLLLQIPHGSGYQDSIVVDTLGRYRLRIEYGEATDAPSGHATYSGEFDVAWGLD